MANAIEFPEPLQIITGDYWQQPLDISTADNYENWRAQWRPGINHPHAIDLDIEVDDTMIILSAQPDKTALMGGKGLIDLQADPGPRTFIRFKTIGERDVTR